jgi:hypothetical protein
MELLHASYCDVATEGGITMDDTQRAWLSDFILRWDMMQKIEDAQSQVARKFSELLLRDIGASNLDEVNLRNAVHAKQGDNGICASHDFCDANMTMLEAMAEVLDTDENEICGGPDGMSDATNALWIAAWDEAKANKFWRKP